MGARREREREGREVEVPLLITVGEAGRLCGLATATAYEMAHSEWRGFALRVGANRTGIRLVRSRLIEWIEAETGKLDPPVPGAELMDRVRARRAG